MTRRTTKQETAQAVWQATMQKAWLSDHPGKTVNDFEHAGSCSDTARGALAFHQWYGEWAKRVGVEALRQQIWR
jgi:hypothetical protein